MASQLGPAYIDARLDFTKFDADIKTAKQKLQTQLQDVKVDVKVDTANATQDLNKLAAATDKAGASAKKASTSFSSMADKKLSGIEAELRSVNRELDAVASSARAADRQVDSLGNSGKRSVGIFSSVLGGFASEFTSVLGPAAEGLGQSVEAVAEGPLELLIGRFGAAQAAGASSMGSLAAALGPVGVAAAGVAAAVALVAGALAASDEGFGPLIESAKEVAGVVMDAIDPLVDGVKDLLNPLGNIINKLLPVGVELFKAWFVPIELGFKVLGEVLGVVGDILGWVEDLVDVIDGPLLKAVTAFADGVKSAADFIVDIGDALNPFNDEAVELTGVLAAVTLEVENLSAARAVDMADADKQATANANLTRQLEQEALAADNLAASQLALSNAVSSSAQSMVDSLLPVQDTFQRLIDADGQISFDNLIAELDGLGKFAREATDFAAILTGSGFDQVASYFSGLSNEAKREFIDGWNSSTDQQKLLLEASVENLDTLRDEIVAEWTIIGEVLSPILYDSLFDAFTDATRAAALVAEGYDWETAVKVTADERALAAAKQKIIDEIKLANPTVKVNTSADIEALRIQLANARGLVVPVRALPGRNTYQAMGGIHMGGVQVFKDGGFSNYSPDIANGHVPHIAPAGAWRIFAEPETGGEAYIPLANDHRRPRAEKIVQRLFNDFRMATPSQAGVGGVDLLSEVRAMRADMRTVLNRPQQVNIHAATDRPETLARIGRLSTGRSAR